jgi:hypothetical protein
MILVKKKYVFPKRKAIDFYTKGPDKLPGRKILFASLFGKYHFSDIAEQTGNRPA